MDAERWKQIDEIFHAALDHQPSLRAAFLAEACKEDVSLRAEIEALIVSHEKESSFFETPPSELAAEFLAKKTSGKIGHYQIEKKIGSGGMGEVYLAEDTRLNRKVALKLLPSEFSQNKDRIRRFEREAKSASALNHPNILTIYDIGQINSSSFIASEYIDGETLRQRIQKSKIPLKEILSIIIQVAEALDAAHGAGIIHRDIKPENIMLRKDGYVKVLDFGLAKLTENSKVTTASDIDTLTKTETGIVLGTIRYMSPEQARGINIDARSDLFSVGVVLYEMIAGKVPFDGATASDVLAAILAKPPDPLDGNIPGELQWIVRKALAKDLDERYQTAKDLLADLKRIRKQTETTESLKTQIDSVLPKQHTKRNIVIFSLMLIALIPLVLFLTLRTNTKISAVPKPFDKIKITRLTSSGSAWGGVISPDGKYVAYIQEKVQGNDSLYLKQLATDTEIPILSLPEKTSFEAGLRFSNDGQFIYYVAEGDHDYWSLYSVPALGGVSHKVIESLNFLPALSPDGSKLAFTKSEKGDQSLMVASADGSNQRKIKSCKLPENYSELAWSPDSKMIGAILNKYSSDEQYSQIVVLELNGTERQLVKKKWTEDWPSDMEWLPDNSGLILTTGTRGNSQIYFLSYSNGELTPITNDFNDYAMVSLSNDSRDMVATQQSLYATIWSAASANPEAINQLTSGSTVIDGSLGLSWTRDDHILYSSKGSTDEFQIWQLSQNGKDRKQLTSGKPGKFWPVASPDGRYITYMTEDDMDIWRIDADGSNPKQLTQGKAARFPHFTPDSKWVVYSTLSKEEYEVIKTEVEGTKKVVLASERIIYGLAVSPDGSQIAYVSHDPRTSPDAFIKIIRSDTGVLIRTFPLPPRVRTWIIHWTPDASGIAFIQFNGEMSNIYIQPINGSPVRKLTNFSDERNLDSKSIRSFSWSMDGKKIAYSRGKIYYDIILIEDVHK